MHHNNDSFSLYHIYSVFLLQEAGRRAFWSVNGPRIVQIGYEDEEDPKVMEAYEQLGSLVSTKMFDQHCLLQPHPPLPLVNL